MRVLTPAAIAIEFRGFVFITVLGKQRHRPAAPRHRTGAAPTGRWRGVARWLLGASLTASVLSGCSLASLGYQRLPDLAVWWVQRQVPLNDEQRRQLRADLQDWHRRHQRDQLPTLVRQLDDWQRQITGPLQAESVCEAWRTTRQQLTQSARDLAPALVRLAVTLEPDQRAALARSQRKANDEFRAQHVDATSEERRRAQRLDTLVKRYETLYGELEPPQIQVLTASIRASGFDGGRMHAERQRRSTDLLATLNDMQAAGASPTATQAWLGWLDRLTQSPTPGYADWAQRLTVDNCQQFAAVHQTTSTEQRLHARRVLAGYAEDFRAFLPR